MLHTHTHTHSHTHTHTNIHISPTPTPYTTHNQTLHTHSYTHYIHTHTLHTHAYTHYTPLPPTPTPPTHIPTHYAHSYTVTLHTHTLHTHIHSPIHHTHIHNTPTAHTHTRQHTHAQMHYYSQSCPTLATPWTVACQDPLSMGFSRQQYWSGLHFLHQGIFLTQESNLCLLCLLHKVKDSLPLCHLPGRPFFFYNFKFFIQ